jgi:hypothetical protein
LPFPFPLPPALLPSCPFPGGEAPPPTAGGGEGRSALPGFPDAFAFVGFGALAGFAAVARDDPALDGFRFFVSVFVGSGLAGEPVGLWVLVDCTPFALAGLAFVGVAFVAFAFVGFDAFRGFFVAFVPFSEAWPVGAHAPCVSPWASWAGKALTDTVIVFRSLWQTVALWSCWFCASEIAPRARPAPPSATKATSAAADETTAATSR